jgi:hypothetical protein
LACILCRSRDDPAIPAFRLSGTDNVMTIGLPQDWAAAHPLTVFDLQQESKDLKSIGLQFRVDAGKT